MKKQERERGQVFGQKCTVSLAKYDQNTQSLRTYQCSFIEDLNEFSATLPKSGMMRNGKLSEQTKLVLGTGGNGFGLLPTPNAWDAFSESQPGGTHERDVPDTDIKRSQGLVERSQESRGYEQPIRFRSRARQRSWWNAEPDVGRVANGISNRVDRLKGLGNAVVPQCVYEIMKRIRPLLEEKKEV